MKPQKTCPYCHAKFTPYPARYRRQKACSKKSCQRQRRRKTDRTYYQANRYDQDYRWDQRKAWRQKYGKAYMRKYRKEDEFYVKRNRKKQRQRNRKNRRIVKYDVWTSLRCGKLMRIHILESDCKVRLIRLLPEGKRARRV